MVIRLGWCACFCTLIAGIAFPFPALAQDSASNAVDEPEIAATSAIVVDASTGEVLFNKDAELRLPPASLTKIFTAVVALESVPLDRQMSVNASDLVGEASMGLVSGETLTLETLLYGLLLPSGNDAAMTIARNLGGGSIESFVTDENARISELGLTDTALLNPHGLDADLHYSSARDLAAMTMFALRTQPDFIRISGALEHHADGHDLFQTNDLHVTYPGLVAGKTGVTDEAGYCLMEVAERDGRRVIAVLLGSTSDAWYADAELLLDYGFAALAVPGRLPTTEWISIGVEVPVAASIAAPAVAPEPAPLAPSNANGLQVIPVGQNSSLVNEPRIAGSLKRSPWFWLTLPLIAVSGILFALAHVGSTPARRTPATARRRAPARAIGPERGHVVWETAPLQTVATLATARRLPPVSYGHAFADDELDLHLIWERATRERLLRGRAAAAVSIGD